jgi:Flp pilus assembly pilin Flp
MKIRKLTRRDKRGAALVEYGLIVAGVALVAAAAVSIFGHKTAGMIGVAGSILPGAQAGDNGAIVTGRVIQTVETEDGINIDVNAENSMSANLGIDTENLVNDPGTGGD